MRVHNILLTTVLSAALLTSAGCTVTNGRQTPGAYLDDAGITTAIKARLVGSDLVDAGSIGVKTMDGTVMLSGFAKDSREKAAAEAEARKVGGVKVVQNDIAIRP